MLKSIRILKFPALLAGILLMVAGCSSSSSSGGGGSGINDSNVLEGIFDDVMQDTIAEPMGRSAKTLPTEGSVTQSSQGEDAINVTITGLGGASPTYRVANLNSNRDWSVDSADDDVVAEFEGTNDLLFQTDFDGGEVYVGLLTADIGGDTDYLAYGLWVYAPATGAPEIGVFMDSNDEARFDGSNIQGLTGDATYTGGAGGIYTDNLAGQEGEVSSFNGDVALTATFGTDMEPGRISGMITRLRDIDDNVYQGAAIVLESAALSAASGGFFAGDTSTSAPVITGETFEGKWGGQFFVENGDGPTDYPGNVAGTFGLANDDNTRSFLGVFLAELGDGS